MSVDRSVVSKLAYSQTEAAQMLDICVNTFKRHVRPYIASVWIGGSQKFPASELQRWLDKNAQSL